MGMDVYGKAPKSPEGEYFRNNVWWWRPLAAYCCEVAPEITAACECWQSNDGDGLDARGAEKLADVLTKKLDDGQTAAYAAIREKELEALPSDPCDRCHGTGVRTDAVGVSQGMPARPIPSEPAHPRAGEVGWCNGCDGRGSRRPYESMYHFSEENVREFVAFLRASGGFEIN